MSDEIGNDMENVGKKLRVLAAEFENLNRITGFMNVFFSIVFLRFQNWMCYINL